MTPDFAPPLIDAAAAEPMPQLAGRCIGRLSDAMRLLDHPDCRREPRTAQVEGILRAAGRESATLVAIARLNLLNEDGPPHRQKRRFALHLIGEMALNWQEKQIAALAAELLDRGVDRPDFDLHRDLSLELVGRIVGSRLGLGSAAVLEINRLTTPIVTANFRAGFRLAEYLQLADLADQAAAIIDGVTDLLPHISDIDPKDLKMLAALVMVPAVPVLAEALTGALLPLFLAPPSPAHAAPELSRHLRETMRLEPPQRYTKPIRTSVDIELSDGTVLKAGERFLCDIAAINRNSAAGSQDEGRIGDLTFGAGPHRCPGAGLSLVVLRAAVSTAVAGYRISPAGEIQSARHLVGLRHLAVPVRIGRAARHPA